MNRSINARLAIVGVLMLLLLVPIAMIGGLVDERRATRDGALADIAQSSSIAQRVTGPLLVVPWTHTARIWRQRPNGGERVLEERVESGRFVFLPERFALHGTLATETRARGIYEARLYHAATRIEANFAPPAHWGAGDEHAEYRFGAPFLALGVSDIRGVESVQVSVDGSERRVEPGASVDFLGSGLHVQLPAAGAGTPAWDVAIDLRLLGTERFDVVPVGRESTVEVTADWPHPSFDGNFLPVSRSIDAKGFRAAWRTSFFATNLEERLRACTAGGKCGELFAQALGFGLVDPVDQYLKSDRAIKYAMLFIGLTFAGFFLFEVLKRLAIHPVQYGLVGLALALFYLLLIALSEHIAFALAYLIAAAACAGLIGFYVAAVLRSRRRGGGFAALLGALYALLYGLLGAEDYALLMGALLVFGLLAAVMVLTRGVDWFGLGQPPAQAVAQPDSHAEAARA